MHISLVNSQENGFKKWSDTQRRPNEDESPDRARPIAVIEPRAELCRLFRNGLHGNKAARSQ